MNIEMWMLICLSDIKEHDTWYGPSDIKEHDTWSRLILTCKKIIDDYPRG